MRFLRRSNKPKPREEREEYPESFTRAWVQATLPSASAAEARSTVEHLRGNGWSDEKLAELVLPYMPRDPRPGMLGPAPDDEAVEVPVPTHVSPDWLDRHLPEMDPRQLRHVVDELEKRGWSAADAAVAVLPHLLPKLREDDAQAIIDSLPRLGMSEAQIARVARR
jgi:hypothetical protein